MHDCIDNLHNTLKTKNHHRRALHEQYSKSLKYLNFITSADHYWVLTSNHKLMLQKILAIIILQ